MTSFDLNYLFKALSPNTVTFWEYWILGLQHMNLRVWRTQFSHNMTWCVMYEAGPRGVYVARFHWYWFWTGMSHPQWGKPDWYSWLWDAGWCVLTAMEPKETFWEDGNDSYLNVSSTGVHICLNLWTHVVLFYANDPSRYLITRKDAPTPVPWTQSTPQSVGITAFSKTHWVPPVLDLC